MKFNNIELKVYKEKIKKKKIKSKKKKLISPIIKIF